MERDDDSKKSHPALFVRGRLPRVGNGLIELRHGQYAGHAKFADDKRRRPPETECLGLIVVARKDRVDRPGMGDEAAIEAIDVGASASEKLADARLWQLRVDTDQGFMR